MTGLLLMAALSISPAQFFATVQPGGVVLVAGAPTSGKSEFVKRADDAGAFRRRLAFDPIGWEAIRTRQLGDATRRPWSGQYLTPEELAEDPAALDHDPGALVVASKSRNARRIGEEFAAVADLAWTTRGIDIIAEEAGRYSREATEAIYALASSGGHVGSRLVCIVQSPTMLTIYARRHLSHVVCFALAGRADLAELRATCGDTFADKVRAFRLGDRQHAVWTQGDHEAT